MRVRALLLFLFLAASLPAAARAAQDPGPPAAPSRDAEVGARTSARALPGSEERVEDRAAMVEEQIADRDVSDPEVLQALRVVPRHLFVPPSLRRVAYADQPLPIGHGQTISQPYIVARMTELLHLEDGDKVLEVGTGSGYQAAVASLVADSIFTIEIIEELAKSAAERLAKLGYDNVVTRHGDGYFGWEEHGPYDGIIVTAAAGHIPPPLIQQLEPGGTMVIPVGGAFQVQHLVLVQKDPQGRVTTRSLLPVRFVPLVGH